MMGSPMHIFQIHRGFLINVDQITYVAVVEGGVLEVHLAGKSDPVRIEDSKEADRLIARLETLSQLPGNSK
jgi:DNA-binding LytR/AlgR family response regulator